MSTPAWLHDPAPTRAVTPPALPTLVYDDDCAFCTSCARWIARRSRTPMALVGFSALPSHGGLLTTIDHATLTASAHLILTTGVEYHGGESITRAMRFVRLGSLLAPLDLPGLKMLRAAGYRLIANNRGVVSRLFRVG